MIPPRPDSMTERPKRYQLFFAELKRRKVFRVTAVYGAVAFGLIQVADIAFPRLGLPDWTVTFVVVLLLTGLPVAMVLAWALEVTPEGVRKTETAPPTELEAIVSEPAAQRWPAGLLGLAGIVLLVVGGFWAFRDWNGGDDVAPPSAPARSIAVLPFANMSEDPANEYFSDGITDDIITHLTKLSDLKVISRTSVMRLKDSDASLKDIAAELGVATILEGGVQRVGDRVRINAQLIDAATDEHLWAEQYNRELTDVFEIQTDVALKIAGALEARLSPEERGQVERTPTDDLEAYNLYLQGRFFWDKRTPEGLQAAVEHFEQALEIDPDYALAWVGIADSYSIMANWGYLPSEEAFERAKPAALRGLELDPALGEAHIALAEILQDREWDFATAEAEYRRGIELSPGYATGHQWYGGLLTYLGRHDEAIARAERAVELDPLSLIISQEMGHTLRVAGEHERALRQLEKTWQLDPAFPGTLVELGHTYQAMGRLEEAERAHRRAIERSWRTEGGIPDLGYLYGVTGRTEEALGMLRRLEGLADSVYVSPVEFAIIHAGLGEIDTAFEWIERSVEERDATLLWRLDSPGVAALRSDPRHGELLRRLALRE